MTLDDQIAELEAGFQDLLEGVRLILQGQQAKIAELRARLEERRTMAPVVVAPPVDMAHTPAPVVPDSSERDVLSAQSLGLRVKPHPCERCGLPFRGNITTRFCKPCFRQVMSEHRKRGRTGRLKTKPLRKTEEQRLIDEVDLRIAVSK